MAGLATLLALFAVGHTLGTAAPHVTRGAAEASVLRAMQAFRFPVMGFERSYWFFGGPIAFSAVALAPSAVLVARLARAPR